MTVAIRQELDHLESKGLLRRLRCLEGMQAERVVIDSKEYINFCSNNYLGLAGDPLLCQAAHKAIDEFGLGSGASRLVCGSMRLHHELEERIAAFKKTQRCLVFNTGYMANIGIISALFNREDIIFADRLNHASLIDGIQLSRATLRRYAHNDMEKLEEYLQAAVESGRYKKKVIITDSVFSMDGDIACLDQIVVLARRYDALVMIDDAHAVGVLGSRGAGLVDHFNLQGQVDIQMGTLSKAVGSFGAYVCGSHDLIEYLINKARSFIYTTAMPPSIAAASLAAFDVIENDYDRRRRLWDNTQYLRRGLQRCGFDTLMSQTPIIPIVVGDDDLAVRFSNSLFSRGVYVSAIRPPTVPIGTARLRVTVMATHQRKDLDDLLDVLNIVGKELEVIK